MKEEFRIFSVIYIVLASLTVQAQNKTSDFFIGKWDVLIESTPNGDAKMVLTISQEKGNWTGSMSGEGVETTKLDSIEVKENSITLYWVSNNYDYDAYLTLKKVSEDKLEGALMDMFNASAERNKETDN